MADPTGRRPPNESTLEHLDRFPGLDPVSAELITSYRLYQRRRGLSPLTIETRGYHLRRFAVWLGQSVLEATTGEIELFLDSTLKSPKTRARLVSDLSAWWRWMVSEGLATSDPTIKVIRPKVSAGLPRPIGDEDLAHAVGQAPPKIKAMLLCAALAGMRAIEISRLDRADVLDTADPPLLVLHGKGNRDRPVPAHPQLLAALRCVPMHRAGPVFHRDNGARVGNYRVPDWALQSYSNAGVSTLCNRYLRSVGVDATIHQLRHWAGTNFYNNTLDLRATQDFLGHSSPAVTAVYTRWSPRRAVEGVNSLTIGRSAS